MGKQASKVAKIEVHHEIVEGFDSWRECVTYKALDENGETVAVAWAEERSDSQWTAAGFRGWEPVIRLAVLVSRDEAEAMAKRFAECGGWEKKREKRVRLTRREKDDLAASMGLTKVRGPVSGRIYYE